MYQPSIRQKITLGYYSILAVIIGLSLFTFTGLQFVERKVIFGETIGEFFDATLEIRRFEKNFFLYEQESDYQENIRYVDKARELLEENLKGFLTVAEPHQVARLQDDLGRYRGLMERYYRSGGLSHEGPQEPVEKLAQEKRIRESGKEIVTISEEISRTERRKLQSILTMARNVLVVSIVVLCLIAVAAGQVIARMVVRPLKELEHSMEEIALGRFETINLNSKDREILSLTKAFNNMLRELEVRQRHLLQSEKLASLGTLLSGVAHELNNPLSNISTSCEILKEEINEAEPEFRNELLGQIGEQTDRARNIVRSLLEFSRDRGFKKEMLPLRRLFEETIRFVKGQTPSRVDIQVDVPGDIAILADKQRIQQAFLNLIENALEAVGEEGGVFIRARGHRAIDKAEETAEIYNFARYHGKCTLEDDTVDIEIRDTGPGIPPDLLARIFDPFFTTKDMGKGSGLGLYIVHEIIEEHDGCIAVDSEVGSGATFLIRLPLSTGEIHFREGGGVRQL